MSDETNTLLQNVLEIQQELLAAYKEEAKRAADFRVAAMEMQAVGLRRQRYGLLVAFVLAILAIAVVYLLNQ